MAQIFNAQNETDLSEYSSTVTDSGDLAQAAGAAMNSTSGGVSATINDATAIYAQGTLSATGTEYRYEFYFDPNTLTMGTGEEFDFLWVHLAGTVNHKLTIADESGVMKLKANLRNDASGDNTGVYTLTGSAQRFEVHFKKASTNVASDGFCTIWADGDFDTPVISITGIDVFDTWQLADRIRIGMLGNRDAGTSGTFYFDEITVRNDSTQIGASSSTPPTVVGPGNNTLGAHGDPEPIPCVVTLTDGSTATLRLQCTSGKGTVDLADLDSGVSVSSGSRASADVTFSGTLAQVELAAMDIEYTGAGDSEELVDTAVVVTVDDGVSSPVSDTFTVTTVRNTITGTPANVNTALTTLLVRATEVGTVTMKMDSRDAIGTDTDTSVLTIGATFLVGSGASFLGKRRRRRE